MILKIKKRIDKELKNYIAEADKLYALNKISPLLYREIREFISRRGKRVRPTLFVVGYMGFSKKPASNLYRSAISLELLHDFMLVHDDIIDKSSTRRGKPSMHAMFNNYLKKKRGIKFSGEDLTIVAGDVMYAMSLHAFLAIEEKLDRKERALKKLIDAAMYTGSGEFVELLLGAKDIEDTTEKEIYQIYDYKTANYTFSSPLSIGAILAGANQTEANKLFEYGRYLGRAFQIKDDILGMFGNEKDIGKSTLVDLQEAKKTILIWKAYQNSSFKNKKIIKNMLSAKKIGRLDLANMQNIIKSSKALLYAKNTVEGFITKAKKILSASKIKPAYKELLSEYSKKILSL